MEYLQYYDVIAVNHNLGVSFKPCYKWNTFNTSEDDVLGFYDGRF